MSFPRQLTACVNGGTEVLLGKRDAFSGTRVKSLQIGPARSGDLPRCNRHPFSPGIADDDIATVSRYEPGSRARNSWCPRMTGEDRCPVTRSPRGQDSRSVTSGPGLHGFLGCEVSEAAYGLITTLRLSGCIDVSMASRARSRGKVCEISASKGIWPPYRSNMRRTLPNSV